MVVPAGRVSQPRVFSVPVVRSVAGILHGRAATGEGAPDGEAEAAAEALALGEAEAAGEMLAAALLLPHAVTSKTVSQAKRRIARAI